MKNIQYLFNLLIIIILVILIYSCNLPKIIHVSKDKIGQNEIGNLYFLPKTSFCIEIEIIKTEYNKGPYALYAQKYLGLNNVINSNSTNYKINNINLSTYPTIDTSQFYLVSNFCKARKTLINLSNQNIIIMLANDTTSYPQISTYLYNNKIESVFPDIFKLYADNNLYEKIDTIIEKIRMDTVVVEKITYKPSVQEKTLEQKAKEASDFIAKIRENKYEILNGVREINYSKEAIEFMYSNLDDLGKEYLKLFTGITISKTFKYKYLIIPDSSNTKYILAHFSDNNGINIGENSNNDDAITLELSQKSSFATINNYYKNIINSKKSPQGIIIRKPLVTNVSICYKSIQLYNKNIPIYQFGNIMIEPLAIKTYQKK